MKVGAARPYVACSCRRARSEINSTCDIGSIMTRAWEEDAAREIELLVRSRYPLIVVDTLEEDRLRELLGRTASRLDLSLFNWTRTRGLVRDGLDRGVYDTSDPLRLLAHLAASDQPGLYTAWSEDRELDTEILLTEIETAVPLSQTMAERVRELREWARGRAVPAA